MRRQTKAAATAVIALMLALFGFSAPALADDSSGHYAPVYDDDPIFGAAGAPTWGETAFCSEFQHLAACALASDAKDWALAVAAARYDYDAYSLHNGIGDAYRHCIYAGALTQRVGSRTSTYMLALHEQHFGEPSDEAIMDATNNATGVALGARANSAGGSDTWGWIMAQCGQLADAGQLTTLH